MCVRKRTKGSTILGLKLNLVFSVKPLSMGRDANAWVFTGKGDVVGHGEKNDAGNLKAEIQNKDWINSLAVLKLQNNNIEERMAGFKPDFIKHRMRGRGNSC